MNIDEIDEEMFEKMKDYLNENNIRYTVNENRTVTIDPQDWEKWVELSHDEDEDVNILIMRPGSFMGWCPLCQEPMVVHTISEEQFVDIMYASSIGECPSCLEIEREIDLLGIECMDYESKVYDLPDAEMMNVILAGKGEGVEFTEDEIFDMLAAYYKDRYNSVALSEEEE